MLASSHWHATYDNAERTQWREGAGASKRRRAAVQMTDASAAHCIAALPLLHCGSSQNVVVVGEDDAAGRADGAVRAADAAAQCGKRRERRRR